MESTKIDVITFFETIIKYYGCKTEISEGLFTENESLNSDLATWNLFEFELIRSAYRTNGERFMFEGANMYYEISAQKIFEFKQIRRNQFEFIECYNDSVFRITKLKFHFNY